MAKTLQALTMESVTFSSMVSHRVEPSVLSSIVSPWRNYRKGNKALQGLRTSPNDKASVQVLENPKTVKEMALQARSAVQNGIRDGKLRQVLQLLLPVDQRQFNFLDTEPRDYPCGIRAEFNACYKLMESVIQGLEIHEGDPKILSKSFGETDSEMDPMALMYPSSKLLSAVLFPISDTLKEIKLLASNMEKRPLLLVNPQWRNTGQVISDFGFGPWKRKAEEFLATFEPTYSLIEQRIGEASNIVSGSGGVVRILRLYPSEWHVYLMSWDGTSDLIGTTVTPPTYKQLEELVTVARKRIPWKAPPRIEGGSEPAPPPLPESLMGFLPDEEIEKMDKVSVRQALIARQLPTSGKLEILKARLRKSQENMENGIATNKL